MYLIKTPRLLKAFYPKCVWDIPVNDKVIYLTFDDGPHPQATTFVLEELKKYNAKASFFCIGNNVQAYPSIYESILKDGHAVGNHTHDHLNGWKCDSTTYLNNIKSAAKLIDSIFFRPPYGRISMQQIRQLKSATDMPNKIIMWDVLSGDFDLRLTGEVCAANVIKNASAGSIIVFHDSAKAWDRLVVALPLVLQYFSKMGYQMKVLPADL